MDSPNDTVLAPGRRFLVGWTTAWAVVGVGVAVGISFGAGVEFFGPVLRLSLLYAQVVGYSDYVSARLVFPLLFFYGEGLSGVVAGLCHRRSSQHRSHGCQHKRSDVSL